MSIRWLPIALALIGVGSGAAGCSVWSEEHLIPQGYVGPVVILFSVGSIQGSAQDEEDRGTFVIGADGVLRLHGSGPQDGMVSRKYYYVDSAGNRTEIPSSGSEGELQVFGVEVGAIPEMDISWLSYVVGVPGARPDWIKDRAEAVESAIGKKGVLIPR